MDALSEDGCRNVIASKEHAEYVRDAFFRLSGQVNDLRLEIEGKLGAEEFHKLRRASAIVLGDIYFDILNPIFEAHPDLMPDALK